MVKSAVVILWQSAFFLLFVLYNMRIIVHLRQNGT
jgi:hypothetical protein